MEIRNQKPLKEPKIIGRKPNYTEEYMVMVGRKVAEGDMSYRQAAKTFGMSHGAVGSCVKRFKKGDYGNATKVKEASEKVKVQRLESNVRDLKHEIADLYLENLMLKKSLMYSHQLRKENSSIITAETLDQLPKDVE